MSQEKVDRYKQEKANRKKNMKKQRIMNIVRKCVLSLAALALWDGSDIPHMCLMSQSRNGKWQK